MTEMFQVLYVKLKRFRKRIKNHPLVKYVDIFCVSMLSRVVFRICSWSIHIDHQNSWIPEAHWQSGKNMIIAFWHNRLFMMPLCYKGKGAAILISTHRDGEYIARTVAPLGIITIRGSTTREGRAGFRQMVRFLRNGIDIAITPDGPKGPRYVVKEGVIRLAKMSGVPIFPVTFNCSRKFHVNSWDSFLFPVPFSRGVFIWGNPITIPRGVDKAEVERTRKLLEHELTRITIQADRHFLHLR